MNIVRIAGLCIIAGPLAANAQDIYKVETFAGEDLNGTARFVSMGGAMSGLGADLSVMGTNPAGIGLYRRSDVAFSGGFNAQPGAQSFAGINKARPSFDQFGFVYSAKMGDDDVKFLNVGFNYHKRKNFKNYIGVDNFALGGLSQSLQMLDLSYVNNKWLDLSDDNDRGLTTPLTCVGYDTQLLNPIYKEVTGANGEKQQVIDGYEPVSSQYYNYKRAQWGGIQQYDFNMAINVNDRFYTGFTLGVYNVNYNSATYYSEAIINPTDKTLHDYYLTNQETISGSGFDVKLGMIVRPFEYSPLRFGFAFSTPVFYDLKADSYLYMNTPFTSGTGDNQQDYSEQDVTVGDNNYRIRTPWKINISAATTIGSYLALNAEYEYANYGKSQIRYPGDSYYDDGIASGTKDVALGNEIDHFMEKVHTFRVGLEARLIDNVFFRAGYNYVTAPFKKDAYLNLFTASSSYYYNTNTDYVNLGAINRATLGLGYMGKHFYADFAYQYQKQSGDLYTFHIPEGKSEINRLAPAKVDLNRHSALLTIGYKF